MTKRNTAYINITLPHAVLKRLDDWRKAQPVLPTRSGTIAKALTVFLDKLEDNDPKP